MVPITCRWLLGGCCYFMVTSWVLLCGCCYIQSGCSRFLMVAINSWIGMEWYGGLLTHDNELCQASSINCCDAKKDFGWYQGARGQSMVCVVVVFNGPATCKNRWEKIRGGYMHHTAAHFTIILRHQAQNECLCKPTNKIFARGAQ